MEGEEENCPAEGGGRRVGSRSEQVEDGHHQLVSVKLRVVGPLLLYQKDVNVIPGIVLVQLSLVFLYLIIKECPHLVEDVQPLVVAGVGREDESEPREHEGSQQDLGAENEDEIVQQLLRGNFNS